MFAIGSKVFGIEGDLDIARKLTDGCVWAYSSTITGIMPEAFTLVPCESRDHCEWNETRWHDFLDPSAASREELRREREAKLLQEKEAKEAFPATPQSLPSADRGNDAYGTHAKRQLENDGMPMRAKSTAVADAEEGQLRSYAVYEKEAGKEIAGIARPPSPPSPPSAPPPPSPPRPVDLTEDLAEDIPETPKVVYTPPMPPTHEEFVQTKIQEERLPEGFESILQRNYILR
jgi:mannosyl-oligosaccharide alpha-1,2-mannosidase